MVWEQHCLVIVMTTRVMERGRVKCGQYWEPSEGSFAEHGNYIVKTIASETNEDYTVVSLELKNLKVMKFVKPNLNFLKLMWFFFVILD